MKRMVLLGLTLLVTVGLYGCAVVDMGRYTPEVTTRIDASTMFSVSVSVLDERPYILSGDKKDNFLGIYRGNFGIPHDALMEGGVPLAQVIWRDLEADLRYAGFTVADDLGERLIEVSIQEYKYDCNINCRVWHTLQVRIKDSSGAVLYEKDLNDNQDVMGGSLTGYKPALRREYPKIYAKMIRSMVRDDTEAMAVLKRSRTSPRQ